MKQVCKYNIIRFEPYTETQEFVNVGIVLYAPKSRRFEFKLLPLNNHGRITSFFKDMDKLVFQESVRLVREELTRIQKLMLTVRDPDALYDELVRAREGIIHYSDHHVRFTTDPVETVVELFQHYVHHSFTRQQGHEERMRTRIAILLKEQKLAAHYKHRVIGESKGYPVKLPFVTEQDRPAIIKPLHFQHADSKKLIDHGLQWLATMNQLFRLGLAQPDMTLITYKPPEHMDGLLYDSFKDVHEQIKDSGVQMLDIDEIGQITSFARDSVIS